MPHKTEAPAPKPAETAPLEGAIQPNLLDVAHILEEFGDDVPFIVECIDSLKKDYPSLLTTMRVAVANHNCEQLERSAHSLKGIVSTFTSGEPVIAAQQLEDMGRKQDSTRAPEVMTTLEAAMVNLLDELTSSFSLSGDQSTPHSLA